MLGLGDALDRGTTTGQLILDWSGQPDALGDSVPLRLAGALHALARRNPDSRLAEAYPPHDLPTTRHLTEIALEAIHLQDSNIAQWLEYPPQTNEVARSALIYPGLMTIAAQTLMPLALYEVGASAGLNLLADHYCYRLGSLTCGRSDSPLLLKPRWGWCHSTGGKSCDPVTPGLRY